MRESDNFKEIITENSYNKQNIIPDIISGAYNSQKNKANNITFGLGPNANPNSYNKEKQFDAY